MSFLLIIIEITNYDQRQIGNEHIYDQSCGASRDPDLQSLDFEVLLLIIGHVTQLADCFRFAKYKVTRVAVEK